MGQEELVFRAEINRKYVAKLGLAQNLPILCVLHQLASALNSECLELVQATLVRYSRLEISSNSKSVVPVGQLC